MTYADFYQLASIVAIEYSCDSFIPFRLGGVDKTAEECSLHGRFPDVTKKMGHLHDIFYRMGFNDDETVVLSGAHCLGSCHKDRSGFEGPWIKDPLNFDKSFFKEILKPDPDPALIRLVSDRALLDDSVKKPDQEAFVSDYIVAHQKLSDLGMETDSPYGVRWSAVSSVPYSCDLHSMSLLFSTFGSTCATQDGLASTIYANTIVFAAEWLNLIRTSSIQAHSSRLHVSTHQIDLSPALKSD